MKKILFGILTFLGIGLSFCSADSVYYTGKIISNDFGGRDGSYNSFKDSNILSTTYGEYDVSGPNSYDYNLLCFSPAGYSEGTYTFLYSDNSVSIPSYTLDGYSYCIYFPDTTVYIFSDTNPNLFSMNLYNIDGINLSNWAYLSDLNIYLLTGTWVRSIYSTIPSDSTFISPNYIGNSSIASSLSVGDVQILPVVNDSYYSVYSSDGIQFTADYSVYAGFFDLKFTPDTPKFKVNYGSTSYEYELNDNLFIHLKSPTIQNGNNFNYAGSTGINLFYNGTSQFYNKSELYLYTPSRLNNNIFTPICL